MVFDVCDIVVGAVVKTGFNERRSKSHSRTSSNAFLRCPVFRWRDWRNRSVLSLDFPARGRGCASRLTNAHRSEQENSVGVHTLSHTCEMHINSVKRSAWIQERTSNTLLHREQETQGEMRLNLSSRISSNTLATQFDTDELRRPLVKRCRVLRVGCWLLLASLLSDASSLSNSDSPSRILFCDRVSLLVSLHEVSLHEVRSWTVDTMTSFVSMNLHEDACISPARPPCGRSCP